jgi:hypothetical protein
MVVRCWGNTSSVCQRHLARNRYLPAPDQANIRNGLWGCETGAPSPKPYAHRWPTTRCMRLVSMASARVIAGSMVVS